MLNRKFEFFPFKNTQGTTRKARSRSRFPGCVFVSCWLRNFSPEFSLHRQYVRTTYHNVTNNLNKQPHQQPQQHQHYTVQSIMFSWSSQSRGTPSPGYPGSRTHTPPRAQAISGSIRPPEHTRAQHIESYLNDDTLKRSTRRVSAGKTLTTQLEYIS